MSLWPNLACETFSSNYIIVVTSFTCMKLFLLFSSFQIHPLWKKNPHYYDIWSKIKGGKFPPEYCTYIQVTIFYTCKIKVTSFLHRVSICWVRGRVGRAEFMQFSRRSSSSYNKRKHYTNITVIYIITSIFLKSRSFFCIITGLKCIKKNSHKAKTQVYKIKHFSMNSCSRALSKFGLWSWHITETLTLTY